VYEVSCMSPADDIKWFTLNKQHTPDDNCVLYHLEGHIDLRSLPLAFNQAVQHGERLL